MKITSEPPVEMNGPISPDARTRRVTFRLTPDAFQGLQELADTRYGGNLTRAIEAGIDLAIIVYTDPRTFRSRSPQDALGALARRSD